MLRKYNVPGPALGGEQTTEAEYDAKLSGTGKVRVQLGSMGLLVFEKQAAVPTTYLYQSLEGWGETENVFAIKPAKGKEMRFTCSSEVS